LFAKNNDNSLFDEGEGINLKKLFKFSFRNKKIITSITSITLLFGSLHAFFSEKTWQGDLQIVLSKDQNPDSSKEDLANLAILNLTGEDTGLRTEVEILKSPLVLKPVFKFVKEEKLKKRNDLKNWRYSEWLKDNLDIELSLGTSVLNLSYSDSDKDLIIPVLQKISIAYQKYSIAKKLNNLNQGLKYIDEQISIYDKKVINSLNKAQKFALENKIDNSLFKKLDKVDKNEKNIAFDIIANENQFTNQNEIIRLDERIKRIQKMNYNEDVIIFMARELNMEEESEGSLLLSVNTIERELGIARSEFTEKSKRIKELLRVKSSLVKELEKKIIGVLKGKREILISNQIANSRPTDIILKYRNLTRQAIREEKTLNELENRKLFLLLENDRKQEPWELITNPRIMDKPIKPVKSLSILFGLISGISLGFVISLILERKKNLIFEIDEFESIIDINLITDLSSCKNEIYTEYIDLLSKAKPNEIKDENIAILSLGDINRNLVENFYNQLAKSFKPKKTILVENLLDAQKCENIILISTLGSTNRDDLIDFKRKLDLQNKKLARLILL